MEAIGWVPETKGQIVILDAAEVETLMHLARQTPSYSSYEEQSLDSDVLFVETFGLIEALAQAIENQAPERGIAVRVEHRITIEAALES